MLPAMARQRLRPLQNTALHEAITAARWTFADTAKAVNTVGAEHNIPMTYGPTAVAHWLAGVTPRPETIPIAVEAFARALDRPGLQAADLGWGDRGSAGAHVHVLARELLVCSTVAAAVLHHKQHCGRCGTLRP